MSLSVKSITVGIPVSNLEKASSWYENLLMNNEKIMPVEGVIEYQIGSVWIQLFEEQIIVSENIIRLEVEDLESEYKRLKRLKVIDHQVIEDVPGIIRYIDFADPDGNKISLYCLYEQA